MIVRQNFRTTRSIIINSRIDEAYEVGRSNHKNINQLVEFDTASSEDGVLVGVV